MVCTRVLRLVALCVIATMACGPQPRQYELRGQILAVNRERKELTIKHGDIPGFMPAMTMPFRVKDPRLLDGQTPGDLVTATLVVEETDAYLTAVTKTGHAEPPPSTTIPPAAEGIELLQPGDLAPDQALIDQDGRQRTLASWRGQVVGITFVYTRCPYPTFCPLMDRHFAAVQQAIKNDTGLKGQVHLLSVSFDPDYDTPAVLKQHAQMRGADPDVWSYVTTARSDIDHFASRFGVEIVRGPTPADFTHNLRTAVVDRQGRLVTLYTGNEWTPDDLLRDLRNAATKR